MRVVWPSWQKAEIGLGRLPHNRITPYKGCHCCARNLGKSGGATSPHSSSCTEGGKTVINPVFVDSGKDLWYGGTKVSKSHPPMTTGHTAPVRAACFFLTRPPQGTEVKVGIGEAGRIEFMWRLFNAFPPRQPRLEQTKAATDRLDFRRSIQTILPGRSAFATTVDYYEAAMPLMLAHARATRYLKPSTHLRAVNKAIASILPKKLF